jgi:hypothetical protein
LLLLEAKYASIFQEPDDEVDGSKNHYGDREQTSQSEYLLGDGVFIHFCVSDLLLQTVEHGKPPFPAALETQSHTIAAVVDNTRST